MKNHYSVKTFIDFKTFHVDLITHQIVSEPQVDLNLVKDLNLGDSYHIVINKNYKITITYGHQRSKNYAFRFLSTLKSPIETGLYEDGPDFKMRGIIEGFYGTPWSHEDRLDAISFLDEHKMNAYYYAPKDDIYHRGKWRDLYPEASLNKLLELYQHATSLNVDFYFCISPGNDFMYTEEREFDFLYKKIDQMLFYGIRHFALLLDDIDYELKGKNLEVFKTPGRAHAHISNALFRYLKSKHKDISFVMCPTEYWQNWDTPYRGELKTSLDQDILVFWTGYNTIAEYIPNKDGEKVQSYFGHELVLWDNYPVNDMTTDRIFLGPLVNRGRALSQTHVGMLSNPMIEWHLSKIPVITMADYMWDAHAYDANKSLEKAIKHLCRDQVELVDYMRHFVNENRHSLIQYYHNIELEQSIERLDFEYLDQYYENILHAISQLEQKLKNEKWILQARPWFERLKKDFEIYQNLKKQHILEDDIAYFKDAKHTIGTNVAVKIAIKMKLYDGPVYKKNRVNYWDQT